MIFSHAIFVSFTHLFLHEVTKITAATTRSNLITHQFAKCLVEQPDACSAAWEVKWIMCFTFKSKRNAMLQETFTRLMREWFVCVLEKAEKHQKTRAKHGYKKGLFYSSVSIIYILEGTTVHTVKCLLGSLGHISLSCATCHWSLQGDHTFRLDVATGSGISSSLHQDVPLLSACNLNFLPPGTL